MKGIILAGGTGSRLFPITKGTSKQLLPVYDKPMIYYPLSTLMLAGIKDILIITTPHDLNKFQQLLGDGSTLGIKLSYQQQDKPEGLAHAFILGEKFIKQDEVCLILGDNLIYTNGLIEQVFTERKIISGEKKSTVFGYHVNNPQAYGVVEFDNDNKVVSIEEKPKKPKSNYAVIGLYIYDNSVIDIAKKIKPSARGELEITTVNQEYLKQGKLDVKLLGRGSAWLDTGTYDDLLEASSFVQTLEKRQGLKIGCIEEIAYKNQWINKNQFLSLAKNLQNSEYGKYLQKIC